MSRIGNIQDVASFCNLHSQSKNSSGAKVRDLIGDKEYFEHIFISDSLFIQIRHIVFSVSQTILAIKTSIAKAVPNFSRFLHISHDFQGTFA